MAARLILSREQQIIPLEQAWNEFRSTFATVVPVDEAELATVLAEAIRSCSDEVETGEHFEAEADGRMVAGRMSCRQSIGRARILVGVCNKAPAGRRAGPADRRSGQASRRTHAGHRALDGFSE